MPCPRRRAHARQPRVQMAIALHVAPRNSFALGEGAVALIERVRALPAGRELPAIVVTARAGRDERQRLLKAGFHQHMLKPVDPWELCRLVASLAERGS